MFEHLDEAEPADVLEQPCPNLINLMSDDDEEVCNTQSEVEDGRRVVVFCLSAVDGEWAVLEPKGRPTRAEPREHSNKGKMTKGKDKKIGQHIGNGGQFEGQGNSGLTRTQKNAIANAQEKGNANVKANAKTKAIVKVKAKMEAKTNPTYKYKYNLKDKTNGNNTTSKCSFDSINMSSTT